MINLFRKIVLKFFILLLLIIPTLTIAEMQIDILEDEISVETTPENPEPYSDVTITISSYSTDLNKAIINWRTSNGVVSSGIGKTVYTFKTKGPDSISVFDVDITPIGAIKVINKRIVIYPSEIDTLWESVDGYTPPFYKGKSFPIPGSYIKVVAIPNTGSIKSGSGNITYTWKNDDKTNLSASGYNKNSYTFKNSPFDKINIIKVSASSVNSSYGAEKTIEIPIYEPELYFYEKSPTEGILYNKIFKNNDYLEKDEITLVAEPYFLPLFGNEYLFSYDWKINGELINTPKKRLELTLRPSEKGGYATISLVINSLNELFQRVATSLKINL